MNSLAKFFKLNRSVGTKKRYMCKSCGKTRSVSYNKLFGNFCRICLRHMFQNCFVPGFVKTNR